MSANMFARPQPSTHFIRTYSRNIDGLTTEPGQDQTVMRLGQKQELFGLMLASLILEIHNRGDSVRIGEVLRSKPEAKRLADLGKGIENSNHTKKIAVDIFLVKAGKVTWQFDDYVPYGEYWEGLHPLARWGGRIRKLRDAVHFSLWHAGII